MRKEQPRISNHTEIAKALVEASKTIKALNKIKMKEEKKKQKGLERLRLLNEEKKKERELMRKFNPDEPKKPRKRKDKPIKNTNSSTQEIDLKTLCGQLGIDPGKARAKLRKNNISKPYQWSGSKLEEVKQILK